MELERIIQDTLTQFIQSHIPAADLRYVEIGSSSIIELCVVILCIILNSVVFLYFVVLSFKSDPGCR